MKRDYKTNYTFARQRTADEITIWGFTGRVEICKKIRIQKQK